MVKEVATQLGDYARKQVDKSLRTVTIVYEDDWEVIYLRNDLGEKYSPSDYKLVVDTFRQVPELGRGVTSDVPLGDKKCLIHYHDGAFVFQFPYENCHSILLSVEKSVGARLQTFIDGCQNQL